MKRFTLFIFFFFSIFGGFAQSISVKSFQALPMDMTASSLEGKRIDQNGEVAALIKIVTSETGFTFEAGSLGIVDSKQEIGEVWVWVPKLSKKITIKHQQLGVLRDYRYPVEIQAERTYEMVLVTGSVETIVREKIMKQFLAFQITPSNATLEVNDQIWDLSPDGTAQKFVDFGTYTYRVQAPNYHPDAGRVTVNDPNNTQKEVVTLKPNFGWIEVAGTGNLQGANVYIDNVFLDKAPCKSGILKSGNHSVRITKEMYQPYSGTVEVKDDETASVVPLLVADFAEVTLEVDGDAEIWVNNELKGTRTWTGPLGSGTYKVECRMANHESSLSTQVITADMAGQTVTLPAPRPIYGSLTVESTPGFATFYLDGKVMGETPKFINELIIGQHVIRLTKEGYADYTETVTVVKGENKQVNATLNNGVEIQFTCNAPDATLEIDGQRMSSANGTYRLTFGQHDLHATAPEHHDYTAVINVGENSRSHDIQIKAIKRTPDGALSGKFSVSASKKVCFSQGNLQYQPSSGIWRFAEFQWDVAGDANKKRSTEYSGWIDLFDWGTGKNPLGRYQRDVFDDWGDNAIINGGNAEKLWRTLTMPEWSYIVNERVTPSGMRFVKAKVNGIGGVILFPDDWNKATFKLAKVNNGNSKYDSNVISGNDWTNLFEPNGAVFLPAAGLRFYQNSREDISGVGSYFSYNSSSSGTWDLLFFLDGKNKGDLAHLQEHYRNSQSVRLVCDIDK